VEVNVQQINGNWDLGYSLDKHVLSSVYIGDNQWGHPEFDTTRSEAGEALFQLKYRSDYNQIPIIGSQMYESLSGYFSSACLVVPMPPSKARLRQPAIEIARELANNMGIPCYEELLVKVSDTPQMKDIESREEKVETLVNAFSVNDQLGEGLYDVLVVDDLFDTGSSLKAATIVLRGYSKIRNIFVAVVTRKR
jgi:predicted amidophosphoribosyltransferase